MLEIRARPLDRSLQNAAIIIGAFNRGFGRADRRVGFRRIKSGFLGGHVGLGAESIPVSQAELPFADPVALFHENFRDPAHGVGADVYVIARFDLTGDAVTTATRSCRTTRPVCTGIDAASGAITDAAIDPRSNNDEQKKDAKDDIST